MATMKKIDKVQVGRRITLEDLIWKVHNFLIDNDLEPHEAEMTVEYPEMWQVEGPDIVLQRKELPRLANLEEE